MASNAHELETDGDTVMQSVNQPVFEFIKALRLEDWSHVALVKWVQARDQYEETDRQRCLDSRVRPETAIKPLKVSIDRKLLEMICLYELRQKVEDRCTILIDNYEPRMVREDVMRHCKYECREGKRNGFISTLAKKSNGNTAKNKDDKIDSRPKQPYHGPSRAGSGSPPGQKKEIKPPITGCWYCKGCHWLRGCPTATDKDKNKPSPNEGGKGT
ncbi:LOW QUALITY PROTEIN: hypothetical protein PHMEG_00024042 [Phytophthora megakarya]|uniref:Uncharacterized protein n=1 Tax=Phytophthora megakarya TaxID=4795 RepID=A0A225VFE4_9STRA|nr:LOW QUALITY PROTEIN: hypothetical protein PHMEG_00024042 [Phytophthora megakarya]